MFLLAFTGFCIAWGFRIEPLESYSTLAIFDDREQRPAGYPAAAFVKSIGKRVKGLKIEAIMPPE